MKGDRAQTKIRAQEGGRATHGTTYDGGGEGDARHDGNVRAQGRQKTIKKYEQQDFGHTIRAHISGT